LSGGERRTRKQGECEKTQNPTQRHGASKKSIVDGNAWPEQLQ
jgi:hypothetical protein